jgi:hypothetical protein
MKGMADTLKWGYRGIAVLFLINMTLTACSEPRGQGHSRNEPHKAPESKPQPSESKSEFNTANPEPYPRTT